MPITTVKKYFFIPHTHLGAGWQHTFDEYFRSQVSKIYYVVTNSLKEDKNATFVICEIGFFKKYYD